MQKPGGGTTTLILLAHQDDEIALAPLLASLKAAQAPVRIVFLTDGGWRVAPQRRNGESLKALLSMGVVRSEVSFLGSELGIPDGSLFRHLPEIARNLERELQGLSIGDIYTLAFEGGHADHDAVCALAWAVKASLGSTGNIWQVPFYRGATGGGLAHFSLFAPLPENGPVTELPLTRELSLLRTKLMRFYPSQWRTWRGIGMALTWHGLFAPVMRVQRLALERLWTRPAEGKLLYERRTAVSFAEFSMHVAAFLAERGLVRPEEERILIVRTDKAFAQ